jgi:hypothetical protein
MNTFVLEFLFSANGEGLPTSDQLYCLNPIQRSETTMEFPGFWGS